MGVIRQAGEGQAFAGSDFNKTRSSSQGSILKLCEQGFVLSLDQASNFAGCSLWYNGELNAHTVLQAASAKDPISRRLQCQVAQLDSFLDAHLPADGVIIKVLFEGVRARLVLITVGAFLTAKRIHAKLSPKTSFVESARWKKWAQLNGASGPFTEIKGVKALREVGFDVDKYGVASDDTADSIIQYCCWRNDNE